MQMRRMTTAAAVWRPSVKCLLAFCFLQVREPPTSQLLHLKIQDWLTLFLLAAILVRPVRLILCLTDSVVKQNQEVMGTGAIFFPTTPVPINPCRLFEINLSKF